MVSLSETPVDQLVSSDELSAKVLRDEHETDDDSSQHVAEYQLQEAQVGLIGQAGNANDGESASFGGDDG